MYDRNTFGSNPGSTKLVNVLFQSLHFCIDSYEEAKLLVRSFIKVAGQKSCHKIWTVAKYDTQIAIINEFGDH